MNKSDWCHTEKRGERVLYLYLCRVDNAARAVRRVHYCDQLLAILQRALLCHWQIANSFTCSPVPQTHNTCRRTINSPHNVDVSVCIAHATNGCVHCAVAIRRNCIAVWCIRIDGEHAELILEQIETVLQLIIYAWVENFHRGQAGPTLSSGNFCGKDIHQFISYILCWFWLYSKYIYISSSHYIVYISNSMWSWMWWDAHLNRVRSRTCSRRTQHSALTRARSDHQRPDRRTQTRPDRGNFAQISAAITQRPWRHIHTHTP